MNTGSRRVGSVTVCKISFGLTGTNILNTLNTYGHAQLKEKDINIQSNVNGGVDSDERLKLNRGVELLLV